MEGVEVELPPVIIGQYGSDPKKKTVLVYGSSSPHRYRLPSLLIESFCLQVTTVRLAALLTLEGLRLTKLWLPRRCPARPQV